MRIHHLAVALAVSIALSGCAEAEPGPVVPAGETEAPSPTTASSTTAFTPVSPDEYRTTRAADGIDGVDFLVADSGISCGIYDPYFPEINSSAPYFGCLAPSATFPWPVTGNDGEDDFIATAISARAGEPASPAWISDATFSSDGTFHTLADDTSITWTTVTCSVSVGEVECADNATGHGFVLSNASYEVH